MSLPTSQNNTITKEDGRSDNLFTKASNTNNSTTGKRINLLICASVLFFMYNCLLVNNTAYINWNSWSQTISSSSSSSSSKDRKSRNDHIRLQKLADFAHKFVLSRKQAYIKVDRLHHWKLRGIGYLYSRQNLLLAATVPTEEAMRMRKGSGGQQIIRIDNVMPCVTMDNSTNDESSFSNQEVNNIVDCTLLTVWVRVNGPEIFAGTAIPVKDIETCHWEFAFDLRRSGSYEVDVKVLMWNGRNVPYEEAVNATPVQEIGKPGVMIPNPGGRCEALESSDDSNGSDVEVAAIVANNNNTIVKRGGFMGFKLFSVQACCEICTILRPHGCIYWATPPHDFYNEASKRFNGCELYFGDDADPEYVLTPGTSGIIQDAIKKRMNANPDEVFEPDRKIGRYHGYPADLPYKLSRFVGCGWSNLFTLDFPCVSGDLDDRVYTNRKSFTFIYPHDQQQQGNHSIETDNNTRNFKESAVVKEENKQLPLCSQQNELSENGRWIRQLWPSNKICPEYNFQGPNFDILKFDPDRPHCWFRDDLTRIGNRCMESNCRLLKGYNSTWMSSVHKEDQFIGYWQNYDCDYLEFTDQQLQQCITNKKISSITTEGQSIAFYIKQYIASRTKNIQFYNKQAPGAKEIVVTTKKLLHVASQNEDKLKTHFWSQLNSTLDREYYFVNSFYLSSERDTLCQIDYQHFVSELAQEILIQKGYKVLNAFDLTAAFTYDTATQNDGMHIIGPPQKVLITKLFHHICLNGDDTTASGTRVGTTLPKLNGLE